MLCNLKAYRTKAEELVAESLRPIIRAQAKIVILEDNPETLESLINLLCGDGYLRENIFAYPAVEDFLQAVKLKLCPAIQDIDLFSVDQFLASKTTGINFILNLQNLNLILEKHRFILVSGQLEEEAAKKLCPLIYKVFDKGSMLPADYYAAVEEALLESFSVKLNLGTAADQEYTTELPFVELTLSGSAAVQYKEMLSLFKEWFSILTRNMSPTNPQSKAFMSMKTKFLNTLNYLFSNTEEIEISSEQIASKKYNLAYLAIDALLREPAHDSSKTLARRKKIITFLLQDYLKSPISYYQNNIAASLKRILTWYNFAEKEEVFISKKHLEALKLVSRLAAIFCINPLRYKEFNSLYMGRINQLYTQMQIKDGFKIPHLKFKENNMLLEELGAFIQKLFD